MNMHRQIRPRNSSQTYFKFFLCPFLSIYYNLYLDYRDQLRVNQLSAYSIHDTVFVELNFLLISFVNSLLFQFRVYRIDYTLA